MATVLPGQIQDGPVEGGEYQPIMNRQTKQVSIGNLLVAEKTLEKTPR